MSAECFHHRKTQNCQNYCKILQILKITLNFKIWVYFWFMGLGQFSECGLVYCLIWLRNVIKIITINTIFNHSVSWPHHLCVPAESYPEWESGVITGLPVPWVCLLCQCASHARSVPACQRVIPEVFVLHLDISWMFQLS